MNVNAIQPARQMSFGKYIAAVDVGASSLKGSFKIELRDEETGDVFARDKSTVFSDNEGRTEKGFEKNFAEKIIAFVKKKENQTLIRKHDPNNEGMVLIACFPGPAVKGGYNLTNFFYGAGKQKGEKFKKIIKTGNIDGLIEPEINFNKSYYANDMALAGASVVNRMKKEYSQLLTPGANILYLYPGGGLGSGEISVGNKDLDGKKEIKVRPSEMQHMQAHGYEGKSAEEMVKAPALRENFANALGIDVNVLEEKTEAVTTYDELNELMEKHHLPRKSKKVFEYASKTAISEFMDGLAQVIAMKTAESNIKAVVFAGPIINGVRSAVNQNSQFGEYDFNPEYSGKYNINTSEDDIFVKVLKEKVYNNLTTARRKLYKPDNLKVVFLDIKNNNEGAHLLAKSEQVGEVPAWYNLEVEPNELDTEA